MQPQAKELLEPSKRLKEGFSLRGFGESSYANILILDFWHS